MRGQLSRIAFALLTISGLALVTPIPTSAQGVPSRPEKVSSGVFELSAGDLAPCAAASAGKAPPNALAADSDQVKDEATDEVFDSPSSGDSAKATTAQGVIDCWAELYHSGKWPELQEAVITRLSSSYIPGSGEPDFDFQFDEAFYSIVFVTYLRNAEDGELLRFTVHKSPAASDDGYPAPYSTTLPGLDSIYEVFLSASPERGLATYYVSTRKTAPAVEALPGVLKQVFPAALAAQLDTLALPLHAVVSRVDLPYRRGAIQIADLAITRGLLTDQLSKCETYAPTAADCLDSTKRKAIRSCPVSRLVCDVRLRQALGSNCAQGLIEQLAQEAEDKYEVCRQEPQDALIRRCMLESVEESYAEYVSTTLSCSSLSVEENATLIDIEAKLKALLAGQKPKEVKASWTYANTPLEHISFALVTSLILESSGDERVKVEDNKLTADPLTGSLTLGVVNIHPKGYDPSTDRITKGERWKLFAGVALTPEFGLAGGVAFSPIRKVSINAGYALLSIDTLRPGDELAQAPSNLEDPVEDGSRGVWFVGLGFNF